MVSISPVSIECLVVCVCGNLRSPLIKAPVVVLIDTLPQIERMILSSDNIYLFYSDTTHTTTTKIITSLAADDGDGHTHRPINEELILSYT